MVVALVIAADTPKVDDAVVQVGDLRGAWNLVRFGSHVVDEDVSKENVVIFKDDKVTYRQPRAVDKGRYKVHPSHQPLQLDVTTEDNITVKMIYQLDGDTLKLGVAEDVRERPKSFDDQGIIIIILKRAKQ
jgi:uncharacterized protein (TIGR03067 family)